MGHQIFRQLKFSYGKSGKSCKSRPNWKPVTLETVLREAIDCKTVRIFAYSSTREQNERSGMRLKTESETGERR